MFQAKSLTDFGNITFVFGSFYAVLIKAKFFPNLFTGTLVNDTFWKNIVRPLNSCILAGLVYGLLRMILAAFDFVDGYLLLTFMLTFPGLLVGACFFLFGDILNEKLGLLEMLPNPELKGDDDDEDEEGLLEKEDEYAEFASQYNVSEFATT